MKAFFTHNHTGNTIYAQTEPYMSKSSKHKIHTLYFSPTSSFPTNIHYGIGVYGSEHARAWL